MNRNENILSALCLAGLIVGQPEPLRAQTRDRIQHGYAYVQPSCPLTGTANELARPESAFPLLLGGLFTDLAGEAVAGIAGAIGRASEERAFNLIGRTSFDFYKLRADAPASPSPPQPDQTGATVGSATPADVPATPVTTNGAAATASIGSTASTSTPSATTGGPARLAIPSQCLVLYTRSSGTGLYSGNNQIGQHFGTGTATMTRRDVTPAATNSNPALYIEARMERTSDGIRIRPVYLWYNEALRGAPESAAAAELQITFATPESSDDSSLGTPFAFVRIPLPYMAPGSEQLFGDEVLGLQSITIPNRPRDGSAATRLAAVQALEAAVDTRAAELQSATNALRAAERRVRTGSTAALLEAEQDARTTAESAGTAHRQALTARDEAWENIARGRNVDLGTTNLEMRFIVTRDANQLGLAIARALGDQRARVEDAVTAGLATNPEWASTDTARLEAMLAVATKQRELDSALADPQSTNVQALRDQLLILKAKANEAAVAAGEAVPFPGLSAPD